MNTDDKYTLQLLDKISNRLGVDNIVIAKAIDLIEDNVLLEAIFKEIKSRKKFEISQ